MNKYIKRSLIIGYYNKYKNHGNIWNVERITKMWHKDTKQANAVRKNVTDRLVDVGLQQTFNVQKKKKKKKKTKTSYPWSAIKQGRSVCFAAFIIVCYCIRAGRAFPGLQSWNNWSAETRRGFPKVTQCVSLQSRIHSFFIISLSTCSALQKHLQFKRHTLYIQKSQAWNLHYRNVYQVFSR